MKCELKNNRSAVLKSFLDLCDEEKMEALINFLPKDEQKKIKSAPSISWHFDENKTSPFEHVHWSWFLSFLSSLNSGDQRLFIHAFTGSVQKTLSAHLQVSPISSTLNPLGLQFIRKALCESITTNPPLPIASLPKSGLNLLLKIEKKKLTELIDILSLFDLASEMRQIVETKILKKIYSFLREEEIHFLKTIAGQKEPYIAASIQLDKWDGTKESLRKTMHKIGLSRLGSALSGQDENLIWYVCHRLDIGRGQTLQKLCKESPDMNVASWLENQLQELL